MDDVLTQDLFEMNNDAGVLDATGPSDPEDVAAGDSSPPSSVLPLLPMEMPDGRISIGGWTEMAYLSYAMSVVKGRALPNVEDGQKPVQRRILAIMHQMGQSDKSKPVKSARIVGEVMGKLHPHGDSSIYEAMVRMAQNFSLRYPLIDGHGNFGSRDGDGAAAMRYTEARLSPYADLVLGEINQGTVDLVPSYDGAFLEPAVLPARLPMLLLNGASGIAVGLSTDIPSHNLSEVADACCLLIRNHHANVADILKCMPGPDFPGGAQLISSPSEIQRVYESGRGSFRVRARWNVEHLARGQWQLVVSELPPGTSSQKILEEIDSFTNPQIKAGKKALSQDQVNMKSLFLSSLDSVRDDSDEQHPVRIVFAPKSSRQTLDDLANILLAHTQLEMNCPVNLVTVGLSGRPGQQGLLNVLNDWIQFRHGTITRRSAFRLAEVEKRLHILSGRMIAFLNVEDVIRIIREAEDPKAAIMGQFTLSELQADDILEIRLRQLARLEGIKIEREIESLKTEAGGLSRLLSDNKVLSKQVLKEIEADKKKFGDERRTVIQQAEKITSGDIAAVSDDPVTIVVSRLGWLRSRNGHGLDVSTLCFKVNDDLLTVFETRSSGTLIVLDTQGRCYNISASQVPSGRGDGAPLSSLVEFPAGSRLSMIFPLESTRYLVSASSGYGFLCKGEDLLTRQRAGKAFLTLSEGESVAAVVPAQGSDVLAICSAGRMLVFPLSEVKEMAKGKGVKLMELEGKEVLVGALVADTDEVVVTQQDASVRSISGAALQKFRLHRARKGCQIHSKCKPVSISIPKEEK